MNGQFLTDRGRVRQHNEDSGGIFYNLAGQFLAIIADGMGGHQAGDVASQMATSLMKDKWERTNDFSAPKDLEAWLVETISEINESIYEHAQKNSECEGMGTTIVIAIHIEEFLSIAHIGDSRCYLLNGKGFRQITEDHSLVNALVQSGQISKVDAQHHPRKNIVLKALGTDTTVEPEINTVGIDTGDKILLCSDGLTDKIEDKELLEVIEQPIDILEAGKQLIDLANARGGEDNISIILASLDSSTEEGESA
ncbi:Stp1/IreP family PP2C-type Ser/Thr phosphatase [Oceanobacillus sp. 143]|jgi:PPM family protein phosphatase|uniref:protein-serine/threonine phosphatase n=1 Tax=Oceanobacillus zhaokaii TaxID=2052660 RepID=A0A345PGA5_9BACI|nr:Stp1/IreP family PP2C-type Ser/Thr phosphatase [Oceanobacillus zhaokaii]AXI09035.1 protein phosphatase [Oceanobacillus zhaokaii]QGS68625.1 Stp1/IreP family PP2C-type Ser/Thr phosphatase [Oceanobacillus sp. 143]